MKHLISVLRNDRVRANLGGGVVAYGVNSAVILELPCAEQPVEQVGGGFRRGLVDQGLWAELVEQSLIGERLGQAGVGERRPVGVNAPPSPWSWSSSG